MGADPALIRYQLELRTQPAATPAVRSRPARRPRRWRAALRAGVVLGGLWALLVPGDTQSWIVGIPCVLAGAALYGALAPAARSRISPVSALRFALFFAVEAFRGGVDVALRAVRLRPALDPGFVEIEINLPPGAPRILFANALSLLPGTLTADLQGRRATIHVIDRTADIGADLARLEARVRAVFAEVHFR